MDWKGAMANHGIFLKGLRKTTRNLSQDSQSLGRDFNLEPCLTRCSVGAIIFWTVSEK